MSIAKAMSPMSSAWDMDATPGFQMFDAITRIFSPYQLNPLDIHPLRDILTELVDFEGLRRQTGIKLFVAATNVRTCKLKVFRTPELTVDTLLASACLPMLFRAVGYRKCYGTEAILRTRRSLRHQRLRKQGRDIVQVNPMTRPRCRRPHARSETRGTRSASMLHWCAR